MIFVDTGAFLARYLASDAHHKRALRLWKKVELSGVRLVTSNHVIDETLTLLGRRASYDFAADRGQELYQSRALAILRTVEEEELLGLELFRKFADQEVSFTDCISFTLMRKAGIGTAFSFDRHFALAGFKLLT